MLSLIVRLRVKPGLSERFLAAVHENAAATLQEPGCARFDVLQDGDDPLAFVFYELYRDAAALEEHRATPHFARWRQAAALCVETQVTS